MRCCARPFHSIALLLVLIGPLLAGQASSEPFRIGKNSVIEGSSKLGGLQPDYLVRMDDPDLEPLLDKAREIGASNLDYWKKVRAIRQIVRHALPRRSYTDPAYLRLLDEYRAAGKPIPLGKYVKIGAGVCRENAFVLHLALRAARIDNEVVYAKVDQQGSIEDHGFVVLRDHQGEGWTVDSYNQNFNGVRLVDLMKPGGMKPGDPAAPMSRASDATRSVVRVNAFPRVRPWTSSAHVSTRAPHSTRSPITNRPAAAAGRTTLPHIPRGR